MYGIRAIFIVGILFLSSLVNALCVSANNAKLRASPSTKAAITWTVDAFTPLIFIEQQGSWVKVQDQDNQIHWTFIGAVTQEYRCMAVSRKFAEARTGPGRNFPPADMVRIDRYIGLKRIEKTGEWFEVMHPSGEKVWVHEDEVWQPVKRSDVSF